MKRSQRIFNQARRAALWAVTILAVCIAAGVWAAAVGMGEASGGVLALMFAAAVCVPVWIHAEEALRLFRLALEEERWEAARQPERKL